MNVDIQNSDFLRNAAANIGGGLQVIGQATLVNSRFISNTAAFGGGVALAAGADALLINNVVTDNRANDSGSGLYAEAATLRALHTTLARNIGGDESGATFSTDWTRAYGITAIMTNTILVSQTLGISVTAKSTATLNGVLWYSNTANIDNAGVVTVTNALTGTPAFVADGYHLTANSKAINAGVPGDVLTDTTASCAMLRPTSARMNFMPCSGPVMPNS